MASTYLKRDITSDGNKKIFTFSMWVKRGTLGSEQRLLMGYDAGSGEEFFQFNSNDKMKFASSNGTLYLSDVDSTRVFRDTSAWYHLVLAYDSTQATDTNRIKLYVNGEQETIDSSPGGFPSQNTDILFWNTSGDDIDIGGRSELNNLYFDGQMSHIHFIDGTAYDATAFGQYDANGVWTIKTDVSVTYGNNGFFILKDGNSVTDQSGNSNNWTVGGGTLTNTEDNPSNVFATMNPLTTGGTSSVSLDRGNNQVNFDASGQWYAVYSTLGAITGKYYAEVLTDAIGGGTSVGIISSDTASLNQGTGDYLGKEVDSIGYFSNGDIKKQNVNQQTGLTNLSSTTIVGIAMDLDNNSVQFYVNGTSTGNAVSLTANKFYLFGTSGYSGARHRWNFGNGYFGTTAISSAGTNASGIGIFEYDVPTGYTALSTKGLNL